MKTLFITIAMATILSACGGGSNPEASPAPVSSPPQAQVSAPVSAAPQQLSVMPAIPVGAVRMSANGVNQGADDATWNITFNTAVNMTVSGNRNMLWVSAAAPGGSATVTGGQNTIVFMPGTTTTVTVSGSGNTFYLPEGSTIKIDGAGATASTVKYFKP